MVMSFLVIYSADSYILETPNKLIELRLWDLRINPSIRIEPHQSRVHFH
jgi:hypothetical protein